MMKSITGTIQSCDVLREGEKNGRKWIMFSVIINGEKFTTFDTKYKEHIGQEATWEYEEKQDGQYINKTLSKYPETKVSDKNVDKNVDETMIKAFGIIRGDIKALKNAMEIGFNSLKEIINSITVEESTPLKEPQVTKPIDNNDIPIIEK